MTQTIQDITDFHTYPAIGEDDWRYAFATAEIRALETNLLTHAVLVDMANADSFNSAVDLLGASEYALTQTHRSFAKMEIILGHRRREVRELFETLCIDEPIVEFHPEEISEEAERIGFYVSRLVPNGATIQAGIGTIPNAVLKHLKDKRNLGVHTEMFSDGLIDLYDDGSFCHRYVPYGWEV